MTPLEREEEGNTGREGETACSSLKEEMTLRQKQFITSGDIQREREGERERERERVF